MSKKKCLKDPLISTYNWYYSLFACWYTNWTCVMVQRNVYYLFALYVTFYLGEWSIQALLAFLPFPP